MVVRMYVYVAAVAVLCRVLYVVVSATLQFKLSTLRENTLVQFFEIVKNK